MGEYLALPDGAGSFPQDFSGPVVLRGSRWIQLSYAYRTFTFFGTAFQSASTSTRRSVCGPYNPSVAETTLVWAIPPSLVTTEGITVVLFSSGY